MIFLFNWVTFQVQLLLIFRGRVTPQQNPNVAYKVFDPLAGRETGALTSAVAPFSGRCATGEARRNGAGTGDGTNDGAIDAAGTGDSNGGNGEGSHVPGGFQGFGTGRTTKFQVR